MATKKQVWTKSKKPEPETPKIILHPAVSESPTPVSVPVLTASALALHSNAPTLEPPPPLLTVPFTMEPLEITQPGGGPNDKEVPTLVKVKPFIFLKVYKLRYLQILHTEMLFATIWIKNAVQKY